jgi:predicted transcriptional regulator
VELTGVLLSIKPKYVNGILNGTKQYEFRKQIFRDRSRNKVFIYATAPVKKIVASFHLKEIIEAHPDHLWSQFSDVSGLTENEFFNYFAGREKGFAIRIDDLEQFNEPIDPKLMFDNFVPPQSFYYVNIS